MIDMPNLPFVVLALSDGLELETSAKPSIKKGPFSGEHSISSALFQSLVNLIRGVDLYPWPRCYKENVGILTPFFQPHRVNLYNVYSKNMFTIFWVSMFSGTNLT